MVILYSTCQKEENAGYWVKYFMYAVLLQSQICHNLHVFFLANSAFPKIQSSQTIGFFPSLTLSGFQDLQEGVSRIFVQQWFYK